MMDTINNLLDNYWKIIVLFVIFLFLIILLICKKKPILDILSDIFTFSIAAIIEVEKDGICGAANKLAIATSKVCKALKDKYPDIVTSKYKQTIHNIIEAILSTPQKHDN